jgi:hypothetical protein
VLRLKAVAGGMKTKRANVTRMLVQVYSYQESHAAMRVIILFYEIGPELITHAFPFFFFKSRESGLDGNVKRDLNRVWYCGFCSFDLGQGLVAAVVSTVMS